MTIFDPDEGVRSLARMGLQRHIQRTSINKTFRSRDSTRSGGLLGRRHPFAYIHYCMNGARLSDYAK